MKYRLLLPHNFKLIGFFIFIPFMALGIAIRFFDFGFPFLMTYVKMKDVKQGNIFNRQDYTDETALTGIILGLLLIAFAREKKEDEFITRVRLESLQWAVLINYILLLAATWLVYDMPYIDVMMYNMLTVLFLFIIRFHILLGLNNRFANNPKL